MFRRIPALTFIFIATTGAWMFLGATIMNRTYSFSDKLKGRVESTWGTPQVQSPPLATYKEQKTREEVKYDGGKRFVETVNYEMEHALPVESSTIDADFNLDHRQKGLLWYSTYAVVFAGEYGFRNPTDKEQWVTFQLHFPAERAIYDDVLLTVDGKPLEMESGANSVLASARVPAGHTALLRAHYRSRGMDRWEYTFGNEVAQVKNFVLRMRTDFKDIDFPENTLSPTEKNETDRGWLLTWKHTNLMSGFQIGLAMPEKLQPGPLAGQISFFAPVSLFFFFFVMFVITTLRNIDLHPVNYFFLATAFFAFHLLLAYLVDHISIHLAFVISSAVSIFLVISYLRLVVDLRFAAVEAGLAQFIYLVLFSYAFFFKGFTGLTVTIGSILTLFVVMQVTGRIRWSERWGEKRVVAPPPMPAASN